jgi:hypothetical protein
MTMQCDGQASQRGKIVERPRGYEPFGKVKRGARRDTKTTKQCNPKTVKAGAVGGETVRYVRLFEMLYRTLAEDALRTKSGER